MFDEEKKTASILMKVTPKEKAILQALATKQHMNISEYIRKCAIAERSVEEIKEALKPNDSNGQSLEVKKDDLIVRKLSDSKSVTLTLSEKEAEELDRLANEAGVSRTAFARYRVFNTKQVNIDLNLDFEGIEELKGMVEAYTRTNRNMLRKVERSNMFTPKDVKNIIDNNEAQRDALVKFVNNMIALHSKTTVVIRKEAKKLIDSERRYTKKKKRGAADE